MLEAIGQLNSVERQLLSEVAVNTIFRKVIVTSLAITEDDILNLAIDENMHQEARQLQTTRFMYKDLLKVMDELVEEFYTPHQKTGEEK